MKSKKKKTEIKFVLSQGVEFDKTDVLATWDTMEEARIDMDFHYKHITRAPQFLFIERWEIGGPEMHMEFVASLKCGTDSKNLVKAGDQIGEEFKSGTLKKKTISRASSLNGVA